MRQTMEYLKQQARETRDLGRHQWKPFSISVLILLTIYFLSGFVEPGWWTYGVMIPAAVVVVGTTYARLNAMGPELMGWTWQLRRIGITLIGGAVISLLGTPFLDEPVFPTWRTVLIMWGLAATWLTTPNMAPWDWYLAGKYRQPPPVDSNKVLSPFQRFMVGRTTREHNIKDLEDALRSAKEDK